MADVSLRGLNKIYGNKVQAVFDFSLDIAHGEFIVLVGPSGCGKSTTLRMVAGLEEITSGSLLIDGVDVTQAAAKNRDIAMVFQNYALYGHMTVYDNLAFSLIMRRENADVIHRKVMEAADVLDLREQLGKKPRQLSGGQRQRVAVGRAIVRNPKVFLFDEPLSNLDAKLRGSMRRELKLLHKRLGATIIYVTHDQIEALTLADRIVVMDGGRIQQTGAPAELYENPANLFVASFIGLPPMNFLDDAKNPGLVLGVRPEGMELGGDVPLRVTLCENLGQYSLVHGVLGGKRVTAKLNGWLELTPGDTANIRFMPDKTHIFDKATGVAVR